MTLKKQAFVSPQLLINYRNFELEDKALDLITSEHRVQPRFMGWLGTAVHMVGDGIDLSRSVPDAFDIDDAEGVQLDVLGELIGRGRALSFNPVNGSAPYMDDENYRIALKAKIAQNQWNGTMPQVYELWKSLFPDVSLILIDNQNMTISALIGELPSTATELVVNGQIIPKPMGVSLSIMDVTSVSGGSYMGMIVSSVEYITVKTIVP